MIRSILIATALVSAVATGAHANDINQQREPDQLTVKLNDTDFNSPAQVRALMRQLKAAADAVCTSEVSNPAALKGDAQCRVEAFNDAVRQINAPQLTQLASLDRAATYADARAN